MLDELEAQLQKNTELIKSVGKDQLSLPTPCPAFDVRTLINHMVQVNGYFGTVATGTSRSATSETFAVIGDDPAGAHERSVEALMKVLGEQGVMDRAFNTGIVNVPASIAVQMMVVEVTVHGWDLAKAIGGDASIDPELATRLLEPAKLNDSRRRPDGDPFGPAVEVSQTALPGDRLVAYLGRKP
jgi:uncharacterized protein (TIGR03086 family)